MCYFNFDFVSDLDIHAITSESSDCKDTKYVYQPVGHVVTGNVKTIRFSQQWVFGVGISF